jgi:hypothetical protein
MWTTLTREPNPRGEYSSARNRPFLGGGARVPPKCVRPWSGVLLHQPRQHPARPRKAGRVVRPVIGQQPGQLSLHPSALIRFDVKPGAQIANRFLPFHQQLAQVIQ